MVERTFHKRHVESPILSPGTNTKIDHPCGGLFLYISIRENRTESDRKGFCRF